MSDDTPSLLNNVSTNHPAHSIALEFFTDESILVIARKYERMAAACPSLYRCRSLRMVNLLAWCRRRPRPPSLLDALHLLRILADYLRKPVELTTVSLPAGRCSRSGSKRSECRFPGNIHRRPSWIRRNGHSRR